MTDTSVQNEQVRLKAEFHREMENTYLEAARLHYHANYFMRMVDEYGGVEAARRLIWSDTPGEGLSKLWELDRLSLSVEACVLLKKYKPLFTEDERKIAHERLEQYHYNFPEEKETE